MRPRKCFDRSFLRNDGKNIALAGNGRVACPGPHRGGGIIQSRVARGGGAFSKARIMVSKTTEGRHGPGPQKWALMIEIGLDEPGPGLCWKGLICSVRRKLQQMQYRLPIAHLGKARGELWAKVRFSL